MSTALSKSETADATAGAVKAEEENDKKRKQPDDDAAEAAAAVAKAMKSEDYPGGKPADVSVNSASQGEGTADSKEPPSRARTVRLEQNRKAARESRRRKKVMIEELQRSVIFFSRANGTLKQRNDELSRLLMQAQSQVSALEAGQAQSGQPAPAPAPPAATAAAPPPAQEQLTTAGVPVNQVVQPAPQAPTPQPEGANAGFQQSQANAVAQQALYESQGFPAGKDLKAAARAVAQTMAGTQAPAAAGQPAPAVQQAPSMTPGATMQAMASFQQAASAAMAAAMQGMSGAVPGMTMNTLAPNPAGANPQQAYTDTMTALAMQQAAVAASTGQPVAFFQPGFMPHPMMFQAPMAPPTAAAPVDTPAPAPSGPGPAPTPASTQPVKTNEQATA